MSSAKLLFVVAVRIGTPIEQARIVIDLTNIGIRPYIHGVRLFSGRGTAEQR